MSKRDKRPGSGRPGLGGRTGAHREIGERAMEPNPDQDALLTPSEVAAMFRVNPKTVTRWARAGKISAIRTLGGHRRFRAAEIKKFLEQVEEGAETP
jgi:excisionase family DNA binding protein